MSKELLLKPVLSEKAYGLSKARNTYVFEVPLSSSKLSIADAVKQQFEVEVLSVDTAIIKGKIKRSYRNKRWVSGKRPDVKKAYVKLVQGNSLPWFADEEPAKPKNSKTKNDKESK